MMPMTTIQIQAEARRRRRAALDTTELERCKQDAAHFIHAHIIIDEAQGEGDVATMPFHLWPAQRDLLADMVSERLLLILKARQLGISWLACAFALWLCLFRLGRVVLIFSKSEDEANELLRRIKVMYWRLSPTLRSALPNLTKENEGTVEWSNGSRIKVKAATPSGGRTFTASLVIMDELAFMQWASEVYTSVKPTVDGGGKLFIISTANGTGNLFHDLYVRVKQGLGRFVFRFLPWTARPERDDAWYAATEADTVQSSLMRQEYPADADEAFDATNAERFLPSILWWDACQEALPALTRAEPLVLAADAGVSNDSFGLVGVSRHPLRPDDVAVRLVRVWVPPKDGKLDFDAIQQEIEAICAAWNVAQWCYDPYQLHQMSGSLMTKGIVWVSEFGQQTERLEADKGLLDLITMRRIAHDGNAELRAHLDNADRKPDVESRKLRIVKRSPGQKVDLAVAAAMACKRCLELNV